VAEEKKLATEADTGHAVATTALHLDTTPGAR
jgi:hypothetical protein